MTDNAQPDLRRPDPTNDELALILGTVSGLINAQQRLELDLRRLSLDVQRLDATTQLMGSSVTALRDDVKELSSCVRRLELARNLK